MSNYLQSIRFQRFVFVAVLLLSRASFAGEVSLAWDPSPSAGVSGYKVYFGRNSTDYTSNIDVGNETAITITGLEQGARYYFATAAYSLSGAADSGFSNEVSAVVPVVEPLTVDFAADQITGEAPLSVNFSATTTGQVTSLNWDFGDPAIPGATTPEAVAVYTEPGVYTVSVTVSGPQGSQTQTKTDLIQVTEPVVQPPVTDFAVDQTSGNAPLTVQFSDRSSGEIDSRLWDFGDGATTDLTNPTHTFTQSGSYTVTLTTTGPGGTDTKSITDLILVDSSDSGGNGGNNPGLVAAYGFEESTGVLALDQSGQDNHGNISGAGRVDNGRFGKALQFNGVDNWVTVADSSSLDLTGQMTLEAWVYPETTSSGRTVLFKEASGFTVYNLYASYYGPPMSSFYSGGYGIVRGPEALPVAQWTHLAATFDGSTHRLYVNGEKIVEKVYATVPVQTSGGVLRIGGNGLWGQYFRGMIDEIRIYDRALDGSEILTDLDTPVFNAAGDESPPAEFIIDNADSESTEAVGTWRISAGANPFAGQSLYNSNGGIFRWLPEIPAAGSYEVLAWWTYYRNRSTQVPYRITHSEGVSTVVVNQRDQSLGGRWVSLGTFTFSPDTLSSIEVSAENGQACADAVRFRPLGNQD